MLPSMTLSISVFFFGAGLADPFCHRNLLRFFFTISFLVPQTQFLCYFLCHYLRRDFALKTRSPAVLFFFFYSSSEIVLHNALGPALNKIEVPNCCKNIFFLAHFKYIIIAIASPRTFQVSPLFFATNFVSFETSDSKGLVCFGTHMATAGNFLAGESPNLANKLLDDYCWPRSSIVSTVTTFKIG